jgi:tetratricopeptide (TPR) repeat protein
MTMKIRPDGRILLYNIRMPGIFDFLEANKDWIGTLIAILGFGGVLPLAWALLRRAWLRRQPTKVPTLDVVQDPGTLLARLYGAEADERPLAHHRIAYQPRQPGRDIQAELRRRLQETDRLLIAAPTGQGKTREACLLAQTLALEGWRILWLRPGWLDAPADLSAVLGNHSRWVVLLDNLNQMFRDRTPDPRGEKEPLLSVDPYRKRLERFLDRMEAQCPGGVRVIATARNEPTEWQALDFDPQDGLWQRFAVFELPPPHPEALTALLAEEARRGGVPFETEELPAIARRNQGGFKNAVQNLQRLHDQGAPLSAAVYLDTLDGTWTEHYYRLVRDRPGAALFYQAIGVLRQVDVELYPELVAGTAILLQGGNRLQRALRRRRALAELRHLVAASVLPQAGGVLAPHDGQIEARPDPVDWQLFASELVELIIRYSHTDPELQVNSLWGLGSSLFEAGMYRASLYVWQRITEIKPGDAYVWNNVGLLQGDFLGQTLEAEQTYRRALTLDSGHFPAWYNLGNLLRMLNRFEESKDAYAVAVQLFPRYAPLWDNFGLLRMDMGEYGEAEKAFRTALDINPDHAGGWNNYGLLLANHLARLQDAEDALLKSVALEPNHSSGWVNLSHLYDRQDRREEAVGALLSAIATFKGATEFRAEQLVISIDNLYRQLGLDYMKLGLVREAEQALRDAVRHGPKSALNWVNLGGFLAGLGRLEEAEDACQTAVQVDTKYLHGYVALEAVLIQRGKLGEASSVHQRITKTFPNADKELAVLRELLSGDAADNS